MKVYDIRFFAASFATLVLIPLAALHASEFHVATGGSDTNPGTLAAPFRTIQHAADLAQPGDVITVHKGTYRERINPSRGGKSDRKRIVYQAAPGERVEIAGSEVVTNWVKIQEDVWQATLPNSFFGNFNPYNDLIHGDWFRDKGRKHHTGAVYLNGEWLVEAATLEDVLKPVAANALWFAVVDATNTTIRAQFKGVNPNGQLVEINVRQSVFYPEKTGINFLTVRGFVLCNAATPWAPPTAEQIGLIGTHWSKGWIIESNIISHSICCGVSLGKYGDEWDNRAESAAGYIGTINRALTNGWNPATIGHHLIRNNDISHCEQAGIVGSLGGAFSIITGNTIHDIHVRRLFTGAEMAGIKFHGAIDTEISRNHIYRTTRGLWLDWMAQGTRVTRNLFHDNLTEDLFVEVDHGPFVVDNNLFLSPVTLLDMSDGGAYTHNLMAGKIVSTEEPDRETPYHPAHSTKIAGLSNIKAGDNRFYNNLAIGANLKTVETLPKNDWHHRVSGYGLWVNDTRELPVQAGGNVFLNGAKPSKFDTNAVVMPDSDPGWKLTQKPGGWYLELVQDPAWREAAKRQMVTTKLLGKAKIPNLRYENPNGSPLKIDADYFGKPRNPSNPTLGPFETPETGLVSTKVW